MDERTCPSLINDESVVFLIYSDIYKKKIPMDGTVCSVIKDKKVAHVSWMEGYKERHDAVPFDDMLAVYDENGEMMKFDNISGKSRKLIAE